MAKVNVEVDLGRVNWPLLQSQKAALLELRRRLECKPGKQSEIEVKALSGVIHLIDAIQDQAADQIGSKNVF
jgi:hypothetical protein